MNKPSKEELDAMLTRWKRNKETAEDHIFLFKLLWAYCDGELVEKQFKVYDTVTGKESYLPHFLSQDGIVFTDCDPFGINMNGTRRISPRLRYGLTPPTEPSNETK